MASINSFADLMLDWENLLAACADHADALASAEPQRALVEKLLKEARDLKAQNDSHRGAKQESRQQLDKLLKDGREAARRLRGAVKANLGTDNERLVQFNVTPNRKRGPRKQKEAKPVEPPATPETEAPQKPSTTEGRQ